MTRYELLDRIGVGGMAEIFRGKAVAAGGFEKPVAIKRILPHLSQDRRFVELLIAEAKVLSLLKHRNIVQIFDVGVGDDSKYFLVMEFVDGKDIGAIQRALERNRRRVPFDLVLHIGAEICEALEHAHTARAPDGKAMSLVHRDVSPSNVLLSRAGEVKLTDFGIAKRAEQDPTNGGAVRGKFAYISPEQARNEHLDPRSDVFSVGILLWELVCNRRLFSHLDDLAALRGVREGQIQRPTEIDPRLPPDIDQVLMTALARDKSRRFATAGQFGQKLRALRYGLEVTVGDPAAELAKIVESTEEVERQNKSAMKPGATRNFEFDASEEGTVIKIRTADAFSARDNEQSIVAARQVIDRFEEEETRLAQLSGDQIRILREAGPSGRDSNEMTALAAPLELDDMVPPRRAPISLDDDSTQAREPVSDELPTSMPPPDEATRLLAPRDRWTPPPERPVPSSARPRQQTAQPAPLQPMRPRGPTPGPPISSQPQNSPSPVPLPPTPMQQAPYSPPMPLHQQPPMPLHQQPPMPLHQQPPMTSPPSAPIITAPPQQQFGTPLHAAPLPPTPMHQAPYAAPQFGAWSPPVASHRPPLSDPYQDTPQPRQSMPRMPRKVKRGLQPWMLVVGALVMAALAFLITRMFMRS